MANESLESKLKDIVQSKLAQDELSEIMLYSMFPAGKLFRPKLCLGMASDAQGQSEDHYLLAAAIEAHHAYTLVHDDLPCMDDDDIRRGREATHKKYGEWKALLAGDALLNLSFELLASIKNVKSAQIISSFASMMGSQGLILGQFIDLSHERKDFERTLLMHELKTARLIQFSLEGSLALTESPIDPKKVSLLGKLMGINFQLLDDLGELTEEVDEHEKQVNAFLNYGASSVLETVRTYNSSIHEILQELSLDSLEEIYRGFLRKTETKIYSSIKSVSRSSGLSEDEIMSLFS